MAAAEKTLNHRIANGGGHTGWSGAWTANQWARLKKGNLANHHIQELLKGRTIENMLSVHPPFQIDGNFGLTAAIAEMLVQSHTEYCELLPALPDAWKKGNVNGLRLRGGITVNISWDDGKLMEAELTANQDTEIKIRYKDVIKSIPLKKNIAVKFR